MYSWGRRGTLSLTWARGLNPIVLPTPPYSHPHKREHTELHNQLRHLQSPECSRHLPPTHRHLWSWQLRGSHLPQPHRAPSPCLYLTHLSNLLEPHLLKIHLASLLHLLIHSISSPLACLLRNTRMGSSRNSQSGKRTWPWAAPLPPRSLKNTAFAPPHHAMGTDKIKGQALGSKGAEGR